MLSEVQNVLPNTYHTSKTSNDGTTLLPNYNTKEAGTANEFRGRLA